MTGPQPQSWSHSHPQAHPHPHAGFDAPSPGPSPSWQLAQQASQRRRPDDASLDRTDSAPTSPSLPHYPIRARRRDHDHDDLLRGIAAIGPDLGSALLPMLQQPMPKGPDNIGAPNCRAVKGIGGTMVDVLPKQHLRVTTISMDYGDAPTPPTPPSRQFINSPTSLQAPITDPQSPDSLRRPVQRSIQPPPPAISAPPRPGKKAEGEFKTNFKFVVNEDPKAARNTVRQHVMQEFRRRERWEQGRNKVSKARRPSKRDSKFSIKTEPHTPTLPSPSRHQLQQSPSLTTSFQSNTSEYRESPPQSSHDRRLSESMSISDRSESSGSEADRFAAMMTGSEKPAAASPNTKTPFTTYLDQGLIIEPKDVEDAVEEIERSELLPYQQDPWAEIARASINPFSIHINAGPGTASKALLHHYAWVMPSLMDEIVTGTVFHRIGWLYSSVAVHDPTPYHTIVGFTLGHIAMLRGLDEPPMAIEHKEKSLKMINRRLANPAEAASDASIGAIANIASYELIDCNPERFAMHMQGLARLVTQRGGISDFAMNQPLETVLIRLDTIRAYMCISQPRFPTWASLRNLTPIAINIGPPSSDWYCPPRGHDLHQYLFCEDAVRLIHGMEDVLMLMRSLSPQIPFTPDPSFRALLIDLLLHHLRRDLFETPETYDNNICRRVLRLAAIVLVDLAAAEFFHPQTSPSPSTTISSDGLPTQPQQAKSTLPTGNLNSNQPERAPGGPQAPKDKKGLGLSRLRARFPSIEQNRHTWGRSVEMIVAVLMQAERMALERPFRAWYVADIVNLTMKLGQDDWRAVEDALMADIMVRVKEERAERQAFGQAQTTAQGSAHAGGSESNPLSIPAWDMDETVLRFWNNWQSTSGTARSPY